MPKMGGVELISALLKRVPGCRVVVMTGHLPKEGGEVQLPKGVATCLEKPVKLQQLGQVVSEALKT